MIELNSLTFLFFLEFFSTISFGYVMTKKEMDEEEKDINDHINLLICD